MRRAGLAALLVGLLSARIALADDPRPSVWSIEVRGSTVFYPDADAAATPGNYESFVGLDGATHSGPPFYDVYGSKHRLLTELELDRDVWKGFGSVSVGLTGGYAEFYGHGMKLCAGYDASVGCLAQAAGGAGYLQQVAVNSSFHLVPVRLLGTYRFDVLVPRGIPLVPFIRGGLDWVLYWNAEQSGQISFVANDAGVKGLGLTTGYEGAIGLELLLDWLDAEIGNDAWRDLGIAHTYLLVEYVDQIIQNGPGDVVHAIRTLGATPAAPAIDLSARYFDFGLGFQF